MMRIALFTTALLLLMLPSAFASGDACLCGTNGAFDGVSSCFFPNPLTYFQDCFALIPFDETTRNETIFQLRYLNQFYSFTNLAKSSGPPYNLQVAMLSSKSYFYDHNTLNPFHRRLTSMQGWTPLRQQVTLPILNSMRRLCCYIMGMFTTAIPR